MEYIEELKNKGELVITSKEFIIGNIIHKVLVTKEEKYYNIYVTNENFKESPMNNLLLQEPIECVNDYDFHTMFCELKAIEFYLWDKYSTKNELFSFDINHEKTEVE